MKQWRRTPLLITKIIHHKIVDGPVIVEKAAVIGLVIPCLVHTNASALSASSYISVSWVPRKQMLIRLPAAGSMTFTGVSTLYVAANNKRTHLEASLSSALP